MPISNTTLAYRRNLPHLRVRQRTYFVTFATFRRTRLTPEARSIALSICTYEHQKTGWLECAVVMPDHAHLLFSPFEESLEDVVGRIKSISARQINRHMGRKGHVWQHESFDRILRLGDDLREKADYIAANPVRAGLVANADDYPWLWRAWVDGERRGLIDRRD